MSDSCENKNKCERIFRPWDTDCVSSVSVSSSASIISTDEITYLNVYRPWENRPKSSMSSSSSDFSDEITPIKCEMQIKSDACFSPHEINMMNINYQYNPAYLEPNNTVTFENCNYPEIYDEQIEETTFTAMEQNFNKLKRINNHKIDEASLDQFYNDSLQIILKKRRIEEITNGAINCKKRQLKKFKCEICEIAFLSKRQLTIHHRAHTGERPYRCSEKNCKKNFMRKGELKRHMRIHLGVKPYSCDKCGKCFGRTDHLKTHLKTHTKLKPIKVDKMKKEFNEDKQLPVIPVNPMLIQFASHFNGF